MTNDYGSDLQLQTMLWHARRRLGVQELQREVVSVVGIFCHGPIQTAILLDLSVHELQHTVVELQGVVVAGREDGAMA